MRNVVSFFRATLLTVGMMAALRSQTVQVQPADPADFPALVDSNSPSYWAPGGKHYIFNSLDLPIRSEAIDPSHFARARAIFIQGANRWRWVESAWADPDGTTVYAWYHAEPLNVCPGKPLTSPQIGALVSDDGVTFRDLGIVLRSGAKNDCNTQNNYFAGGHGDFSVILDQRGENFYFLFTNYGGTIETQGVAIARMAFADRADPIGNVWKFYNGDWSEAGLGGKITPVFAAASSWSSENPDSYWGPAIHWNTALQQYVVLMNHVGGDRLWTQEGIYMSFTPDLANPGAWTPPKKLMDANAWYPQVLGYGPGETDTLAGAKVRLFVMGHSEWDLVFTPETSNASAPLKSAHVPKGSARRSQ